MTNEDKGIMQYESVLPAEFDGVFRFTNWSNEEFIGVWGKREYHFPALTTSPMIIPEHSPLEIQHIRKKFAKDLAEREFYKSSGYRTFQTTERNSDGSPRLNSIHQATAYSINELTPFIQKALQPLSVARASITSLDMPNVEDKLSRNEEGELNTEAVDKKTSLRKKALEA